MTRIALVAPGAVPPLTEGRKRLVVDLAATLRARGIDVTIIDGMPAVSPALMIRRALADVRRLCEGPARPDHLAVFPFGTFYGLRGWANAWLLHKVRSIQTRAGIVALPVFYSCTGLGLSELGRRFGPALTVGRSAPSLRLMHLGVDQPAAAWQSTMGSLRRLLFLCGYQNPTQRAFHDVLHERGLADLLRAGSALAQAGIRLTVAVPFLRFARMREYLSAEIARACPTLVVDMQAEVDTCTAFTQHDAFVFPYRQAHAVFIPTSLLEALSIGIPVLAADHEMYRALTIGNEGARCSLYKVGDADDLIVNTLSLQSGYRAAVARAKSAAKEVRLDWNLDRCADDFLAAFDSPTG